MTADAQDRVDLLTRQAERTIQGQLGRRVILRDPTLIAARERSLVVRCATTGWDDVASVVLKRHEGDDTRAFTDWAGLAFLSSLDDARGVAPLFYVGDARERLVVMEDLGQSRSLAGVLENGNAATVVEVLEALAATMARLITATAGQEEAFARIRAALPGAADMGRQREAAHWLEARERIARWADALDISLPHAFDAICEHIAAVYADPGPYLAFSHGDPAPSNNHISAGRVRLLDFEYACYRHALYDLSAWAILCPLPWAWVAAMERVFRCVLSTSLPGTALVDEGRYSEEWVMMCAYRALAMITWFSPDLLVRDGAWTPGWTRRAALLSTASRLHQVSAGVAALEPLAEFGGRLSDKLRIRWPEVGDGALDWPGVIDAP